MALDENDIFNPTDDVLAAAQSEILGDGSDLYSDEELEADDEDDTAEENFVDGHALSTRWDEIVGEESAPSLADALRDALNESAHGSEENEEDVVGEVVSPITPSGDDYLARRAAAASGVVVTRKRRNASRDWQLDFGPVWGPAGETTTITIRPQCLFRGEKIMATDTAPTPGLGTRIVAVTVGQKLQRPAGAANGGTLSTFFGANSLANGILFDTAKEWSTVAVTVSFVQTCTFEMSVFGKAVVEE